MPHYGAVTVKCQFQRNNLFSVFSCLQHIHTQNMISNKTFIFKPVLSVFPKMKYFLYKTDDCVLGGKTAFLLLYFLFGFHRAKHTKSLTTPLVLKCVINTVAALIYSPSGNLIISGGDGGVVTSSVH